MSKFYGKLFNIFVVSHLSANHKYDNLHMQIDIQKDFDLSWVGRFFFMEIESHAKLKDSSKQAFMMYIAN